MNSRFPLFTPLAPHRRLVYERREGWKWLMGILMGCSTSTGLQRKLQHQLFKSSSDTERTGHERPHEGQTEGLQYLQ